MFPFTPQTKYLAAEAKNCWKFTLTQQQFYSLLFHESTNSTPLLSLFSAIFVSFCGAIHLAGSVHVHVRVDTVQPDGIPAVSGGLVSQWAAVDSQPDGPAEK